MPHSTRWILTLAACTLLAHPASALALFRAQAVCAVSCEAIGLALGGAVEATVGFDEADIGPGVILDGSDVVSFEAVFGVLAFDLSNLDLSGVTVALDADADAASYFQLFASGSGSDTGFFIDEVEWLAGPSVGDSAGGDSNGLIRVPPLPEPGTGALLGLSLAAAALAGIPGGRRRPGPRVCSDRLGQCPARATRQPLGAVVSLLAAALLATPALAERPSASCPSWDVRACRKAARVSRWCDSRQGRAPRPNIVLVLTDDQRADTLHHFPTITDRLVDEGVRFENSFVTTPLCGPSRASTLTGRYAHATGVLANDVRSFDPSSTLATWLQDAGYRTALLGKYMNGYQFIPTEIPPGWDRWQTFLRGFYYHYVMNLDGDIVFRRGAPEDYSTDVIAQLALDFIDEGGREPFFLMLAPFAPHATAVPAPRHEGAFEALPVFRPPGYLEIDLQDKPFFTRWLQFLRVRSGLENLVNWSDDIHTSRVGQLESLLSVDEAIASILARLEERGVADDTIVIFTSDNGLHWGEHWLRGKFNAYEPSLRVPLVIRYPRLVAAGQSDPRLVLNLDLAPTLAELAGARVPDDLDGESMVDALCGGEPDAWRSDFLFEYFIERGLDGMPAYAGVRSAEWKYIEYIDGFRELYDLVNDPAELDNLLRTAPAEPRTIEQAARLHDRLIELRGPEPVVLRPPAN